MKIAIIGGHLAPALSVIEALPRDTKILFFGRKYALEGDRALSLEYKTITSYRIRFLPITTGRLQRKLTKYTISSILKLPVGFVQSTTFLRRYRPDVVLGFGGYLSLPVCLASFFLKIPVVVHEQTLRAGLSNRIISLIARKVCISWESSFRYFPKEKTILTGNPIREFKIQPFDAPQGENSTLRHPPKADSSGREFKITNNELQITNSELPIIYITGGSLGSHFINTLVEKNLKALLKKFVVIHQTGDAQNFKDFDRLNNLRESLSPLLKERYILTKFIDPRDIGYVLQKADLVVARSGINTITELIFFKKPSLLIPLPFSQGREQLENALFVKSKGLAEIFRQDEDGDFLERVTNMLEDLEGYKKNTEKLEGLISKNANVKIAEVVIRCLQKQEKQED